MLLIPAIDLKDGKCVRLRQGRMEDETVFSDDPVAVAGRWVGAGARRLHIVDLNGAFAGQPRNAAVVHSIAQAFPDLPIQVGGGIRDGLKAVGDVLGALADASPGLQAAGVALGTLAGGFTVLGAAVGLVSMGSLISSIPVVAGLMSAWGAVTTAVGDAWANGSDVDP